MAERASMVRHQAMPHTRFDCCFNQQLQLLANVENVAQIHLQSCLLRVGKTEPRLCTLESTVDLADLIVEMLFNVVVIDLIRATARVGEAWE
jgi:hypothetical protein